MPITSLQPRIINDQEKMVNYLLISSICICFVFYPAFEILMGTTYKNNVDCESTIGIRITDWLIMKGVFTILNLFSVSLYLFSSKKSVTYCIIFPINILFNIFNFAWVIVGTVILYRDCIDFTPSDLNSFTKTSIYINYILCLIIAIQYNKRPVPTSVALLDV